MLDRIPLRAARREMADRDRQASLITEALLELLLPPPGTMPVAPSPIGQNQQMIGMRKGDAPGVVPPLRDRGDGKRGGVGGVADNDGAAIGGQIVDAVGDGASQGLLPKVVDVDRLRLLAPGPSRIL